MNWLVLNEIRLSGIISKNDYTAYGPFIWTSFSFILIEVNKQKYFLSTNKSKIEDNIPNNRQNVSVVNIK